MSTVQMPSNNIMQVITQVPLKKRRTLERHESVMKIRVNVIKLLHENCGFSAVIRTERHCGIRVIRGVWFQKALKSPRLETKDFRRACSQTGT